MSSLFKLIVTHIDFTGGTRLRRSRIQCDISIWSRMREGCLSLPSLPPPLSLSSLSLSVLFSLQTASSHNRWSPSTYARPYSWHRAGEGRTRLRGETPERWHTDSLPHIPFCLFSVCLVRVGRWEEGDSRRGSAPRLFSIDEKSRRLSVQLQRGRRPVDEGRREFLRGIFPPKMRKVREICPQRREQTVADKLQKREK